MNFFRTAVLCCFLALQGQAAICPMDLLQAIDCAAPNLSGSCCSSLDAEAVCPCSSEQSSPFSQEGKESCGGCQMEAHEHPSVWQIQANDRLPAQPNSFSQALHLEAAPTAQSYRPFAWMLEAPPRPKAKAGSLYLEIMKVPAGSCYPRIIYNPARSDR